MRRSRSSINFGRGWFAVVLLAFVIRALVPQGFMIGTTAGVPLVVCSAHGQDSAAGSKPAPGVPSSKADHLCPFAGFQAIEAPVRLDVTKSSVAWRRTGQPRFAVIVYPGRGLAAPPPPSHARPVLFQS